MVSDRSAISARCDTHLGRCNCAYRGSVKGPRPKLLARRLGAPEMVALQRRSLHPQKPTFHCAAANVRFGPASAVSRHSKAAGPGCAPTETNTGPPVRRRLLERTVRASAGLCPRSSRRLSARRPSSTWASVAYRAAAPASALACRNDLAGYHLEACQRAGPEGG
jgi:hypothetical protein